MIKVVLIDDHDLVRSGLRQMLETDSGIEVVGEAGTGAEGIQLVRTLKPIKPDVVVLDVNLPDITGLEVTHRLLSHQEDIKILIVSGITNDLLPFKLLDAGALSYLTKNASREELIHALKTTYAGQRFVTPAVASRLVFSKLDAKKGGFSDLTDRETEVMMMIIRSIDVKKIAEKLHLSTKTVHSYRNRIFQKLNVKNDMGLMLLSIKEGIVALEETEPPAFKN